MVDRLIALRAKAMSLVATCFANNSDFIHTVSQAFEVFINKRENKPAEQMAKYLDAKLRTSRAVDDAELEKTLQDVLFLFRFTQGKDIFEAFYKRDLAKRLLLNKSASFDAERSMLNKLKDGKSMRWPRLITFVADPGLSYLQSAALASRQSLRSCSRTLSCRRT